MATAFKVRYTSDYAKYVEQLAQFEAHLTSNYADLFIKHEFFGVQVQPGWWPLVESMCQTLQQYVSMHPDIGLKVYDFHTMHGQLAARMDYADLFVAGVMAMAKDMSKKLCEECGQPGWLRLFHDGPCGQKVMCQSHSKEQMVLRIKHRF